MQVVYNKLCKDDFCIVSSFLHGRLIQNVYCTYSYHRCDPDWTCFFTPLQNRSQI
jgi:hypothetical protein